MARPRPAGFVPTGCTAPGKALVTALLLATLLALLPTPSRAQALAPQAGLEDLATRYAAAWSGQDPARLAAFYAEDGLLVVNQGEPAVGRAAIAAKARGFMQAFPDMTVRLRRVEQRDGVVEFHWRWTGTNTGPGGTGRAVDLVGYEEWTLDGDGLIVQSLGHYDAAEYERQVNGPQPGS
ncbi:MAG: nuclear transport factor 2 family protein, partial [Gammaproteobacteria bacterium]